MATAPYQPRPHGRRITSIEFAAAMVTAGVLPEEPGAYRRIVIELGPDGMDPVIIHAETYADDAWLSVVPALTGVEVRTGPAGG